MKTAPLCSRCERELHDWEANVMVDSEPYFKQHKIEHIFVLCKSCTRIMDEDMDGRKHMHNLWELKWLQQNFFHWFGSALYHTMSTSNGATKWSRVALLELCRLGEILHPQVITPFLGGFESED